MKNLLKYAKLTNCYLFEFSDEEFDYLIANIKNNIQIQQQLPRNSFLKQKHIDLLIKDENNVWDLLSHNLTEENINYLIDSNYLDMKNVILSQNLSSKIIDKLLGAKYNFSYHLATKTNLTIKQINKLLSLKDNGYSSVCIQLINNPCVPEEIKQKIIDDRLKEEVFK